MRAACDIALADVGPAKRNTSLSCYGSLPASYVVEQSVGFELQTIAFSGSQETHHVLTTY